MPVHRASGLLSRLAADAVRIVVTTAVILCAGLVMGFRFRQGFLASVAWVFVPTVFGLAFTVIVITLALYAANTIVVEGTEVIWGMLMFFSSGFVPLDQFPHWIQPVVHHQPVSYSVEAMRGLSLGGPVLAPTVGMLLWSAGIVAVVRDTDGDRVSTGKHAWMIAESSCPPTAEGVEDVCIVGHSQACAQRGNVRRDA